MEIQDFLTFEIENASVWMVQNPDSNSDSKKKKATDKSNLFFKFD